MAYSFDDIMARMLGRVPDIYDKREGSVIWDALAPAAYEMSLAYAEMKRLYDNTFVLTSDREGLVQRAAEYDLRPLEAIPAVRKGYFTPASVDIPMAERFNFGELNFVVTAKLADGEYLLTCETVGEAGNAGSGALLPIGYIPGLETAILGEVVSYGEEEEDTEVFRERFCAILRGDAKDGNVAQYKMWAATYSGIGNAKVLPLWNGANTVKVSILSSENTPASQQLVQDFQSYLDPGSTGLGNGVAPIGAIVTVSTATEVSLNITGSVTLAAGYSDLVGVEEAVRDYLKKIAYVKSNVPYMGLGAVIQDCPCVESLSNFRINGGVNNINLQSEQIGKLNKLTLEVV